MLERLFTATRETGRCSASLMRELGTPGDPSWSKLYLFPSQSAGGAAGAILSWLLDPATGLAIPAGDILRRSDATTLGHVGVIQVRQADRARPNVEGKLYLHIPSPRSAASEVDRLRGFAGCARLVDRMFPGKAGTLMPEFRRRDAIHPVSIIGLRAPLAGPQVETYHDVLEPEGSLSVEDCCRTVRGVLGTVAGERARALAAAAKQSGLSCTCISADLAPAGPDAEFTLAFEAGANLREKTIEMAKRLSHDGIGAPVLRAADLASTGLDILTVKVTGDPRPHTAFFGEWIHQACGPV